MTTPNSVTPPAATPAVAHSAADIESATKELAKLPLLGPVLWLYARDPQRKYTFVADMDFRLLPPLIHNQCHLLSRGTVPWAFFSWAFVSEAVDARLRTTQPVIAPHEWKSGAIPWLIDVVMPFSVGANVAERENLLAEACKQVGGAKPVHGWVEDGKGGISLRTLPPHANH